MLSRDICYMGENVHPCLSLQQMKMKASSIILSRVCVFVCVCVCVCLFVCLQAKVERVVVDGVGRTKDDVIIKEVRPLLESATFQEVSWFYTFHTTE